MQDLTPGKRYASAKRQEIDPKSLEYALCIRDVCNTLRLEHAHCGDVVPVAGECLSEERALRDNLVASPLVGVLCEEFPTDGALYKARGQSR